MSNATRILIAPPGSKTPLRASEIVSPNGYAAKTPWVDLAASITGFTHMEYMAREYEIKSRIREMTLDEMNLMRFSSGSLIAMMWEHGDEICGRVYEDIQLIERKFGVEELVSFFSEDGLMLEFRPASWKDLDSFTAIM